MLDSQTQSPEIDSPEPEVAQIVETSSEQQVPKREQVFAVVMVSNGKTAMLYAFFW